MTGCFPMITDGDRCGGDRSGVLQQLPAPGNQGRRNDLGTQRSADHQRADGGCHRIRSQQEGWLREEYSHL